MKRVLVTGASGFIGRHSLPALAARGFDVHALCREGAPDGPATWHRADLHDRDAAARLFEDVRPTHLLHLAWYAAHGKYWTSPENLRWVESSLALLRAFTTMGGERVVCAGTCAEYDWRYGFCSERVTPLAPATLYGTAKRALQDVAAAYAQQVGLSMAWGRIFFLHGPGEHPARLVPSVIRAVLDGAPVRCSHGNQIRDYLYVEDVADAFAALLDSRVEGPVNIASGRPIRIQELVSRIVGLVPEHQRPPIEFGAIAVPPDDPPLVVADVRRLNAEVGWMPRYDHDRALAQTARSLGWSEALTRR